MALLLAEIPCNTYILKFTIESKDPQSKARTGSISTDHGEIQTPIFMPVGTLGSVKAINQDQLKTEINAPIILGNTYHLYLKPGMQIMQEAGGLHKFMNWDRALLTDSGGYQVYSLAENRKITDEGVTFRSHIDGSKHFFSPEKAIDIQRQIGADIIMAFDECTPYPCDKKYATDSLKLTHNWLLRCQTQMKKTKSLYDHQQALFPIVQGSTYSDLRVESAKFIADQDAFGNAIGGLSVGEPAEEMYAMTEVVCSHLPIDKPRYLMGVGTPSNLLECIALGVDMFDCVMPTRNARNGGIFTKNGTMNMRNAKWANDYSPLDEEISPNYSKAYVRHLIHSGELLGIQITSLHNLKFYLKLMEEARAHITAGDFLDWKNKMVQQLNVRL